jgi:DNA-binding NarL/FixJ family response regulator
MIPNRISGQEPAATDAPPTRVLVVDDHAPTRAAVATLLDGESPRIEVVGVAGCSEGAMRLLREAAPDVVVLDLDLEGKCSLDLLPLIRRNHLAAVVILTASNDPFAPSRALAAGAVAFVSKLSPAAELIDAILATRSDATGMGGLSCPSRTL